MVSTAPTTTELEAHWHRYGHERVMHHTARFADLARGLSGAQLALVVPGSEWTVHDVVAHVASVWRRYTVNRDRAGDAAALATQNAAEIDGIGAQVGMNVGALVEDMVEQMGSLGPFLDHIEPGATFDFHAGQQITMAGGWGNAINELLVHGDDIARATGVPWSVDDADLEPFWRYTARAMPGWFNDAGRQARDRWELDLGFASGPVHLRFTGGGIAIDEPVDEPVDETADHRIAGPAADVTLTVPWRRRPTDDPQILRFLDRLLPI